MEQVSVCYVASVTESEAGWGSRPDGYVIGWDKELMEKWFKDNGTILCGDAREYSRVDLPLEMKILTEDGVASLNASREAYESGEATSGRPFAWHHRIGELVRS